MGNFTNTCQDVRNLTYRPRDNLTFRKELETMSHANAYITFCGFCNRMFVNDNCQSYK